MEDVIKDNGIRENRMDMESILQVEDKQEKGNGWMGNEFVG